MQHEGISRRRILGIVAAAPGLALPGLALPGAAAAAEAPPVTWRGPVLGALGQITLHHPDKAVAERLIASSLMEIRRLEAMFSLWRDDSLLSELNRRGALAAPPPEMVDLLSRALDAVEHTGGAFDPIVQPLWALHAAHFGAPGADPAGPAPAALEAALAKVSHTGLRVTPDRVVLLRRGLAVTLNGIAQGYITDRVVALLRVGGVARTLVDLGEARTIGARSTGRPWLAAISDPEAPGATWGEAELTDRALASSADLGFVFDRAGRFTHLLDPRSGLSPRLHRAVSVLAPEATLADGLATGFALMPEDAIRIALRGLDSVEVRLLRHDGSIARLSAA
ncbi:FAD:protein FMN transferase [Falsiroseomonas sp. E2-1-a20]|uniref:FAD:protein FMN transferase n=1 Tax=Falsiroseomonas sp. E2-1-a20 TaxID=3239300 RepID=UPI003F3EDF65